MEIQKIFLVKPNILVRKGFVLQSRMCPPIGLCYLAGTLRPHGHVVEILDTVAEAPDAVRPYRETHQAYGLDDEQLLERIRRFSPDVVGIGGFTSQTPRIREMVSRIKEAFPEVTVVLGGAAATVMPEYMLRNTLADFLIMGEGEQSFLELLRRMRAGGQDFIGVDGLAYRKNGQICVNPKTLFQNDIDAIPWPARDLLRHEAYHADGVAMPVITSRSCPGHCSFCSVHSMSGKKWRGRDPLDVADEIEHVVTDLGYKTVSIFDDAANVVPERLATICREVVRRKLDVRLTFPSSLIMNQITRELLECMKDSGAIGLSLSIEHASEHMRNTVMRKNLNLEHVDRVITWCKDLGLLTLGNFVIGMPGETHESLDELAQYLGGRGSRLDLASVYVATPFPGTPFYEQCLGAGLIKSPEKKEFLDFDTYEAHILLDTMTQESLFEHKAAIEAAFQAAKGEAHPAGRLRKIFRKPDNEGVRFLETEYFKTQP
ncbi:B12-binding domain-containing radical SAM protein [Fundidesulfovibrio terrae]|uniref:B12-binding domain-containing radical SAM protein n=1 Tax=Fundidesulfovibrio terrae TaxID=2922866 RepID=UPI001FB0444E|nr:radical SAM protein [Fundidesulfovibrio terrae]